jgi:hypothetical protein
MTDRTKLGFAVRCAGELWLALELCVVWVQGGETCTVCGRFWSKYLRYLCPVGCQLQHSLQLDKWDCPAGISNSAPIITSDTSVLSSLDCFSPLKPDFSSTNHVEFQRDKVKPGQIFLPVLRSSTKPPYVLIYHRRYDSVSNWQRCDFRLQPRSSWELHCSMLLRSV